MASVITPEVVPEPWNNVEIQKLARFAVDEYNKKENASLEYVGVTGARKVADSKYYIILEAKKVYVALVWEKPGSNTELVEFEPLTRT